MFHRTLGHGLHNLLCNLFMYIPTDLPKGLEERHWARIACKKIKLYVHINVINRSILSQLKVTSLRLILAIYNRYACASDCTHIGTYKHNATKNYNTQTRTMVIILVIFPCTCLLWFCPAVIMNLEPLPVQVANTLHNVCVFNIILLCLCKVQAKWLCGFVTRFIFLLHSYFALDVNSLVFWFSHNTSYIFFIVRSVAKSYAHVYYVYIISKIWYEKS